MTADTGKPDEPLRRRVANWLLVSGASIATLGIVALTESGSRYWPHPRLLDYVLAVTGVLATIPWLITVARDETWWRAYRKGRITRDQYKAYRACRTGWPSSPSLPL